MANFKIKNVVLSGLAVAVPKTRKVNLENLFFSKEDIGKFTTTTGVSEFRIADKSTTSSDLGFEAAQKLILEMDIDKKDIDVLIFVSQTPDYLNIPNTAPQLQNKLGLSKNCIAFDLSLGCSGFIYGLSTLASFMQNPAFKKGLLICGDTISKIVNPEDKSTALLFGDAASAVVLKRKENDSEMQFNLGCDGSGYKAIIVNDGGSRNPFNANSLHVVDHGDGIKRNQCELVLDGMDVFGFGINQAPKTFRELCDFAKISNKEIDFAIFHQANKMMNEMIRKKLKLEKEKVPYSLDKFGNTSSASIPVTMVTELKNQLRNGKNKLLLCGFGVGLSWGSCYFTTEKLTVLDLIEI
ncbi:3-oxoacyl-ACP synthase III family protein [Flavobacterium sp. HJJ]|uniref:3-oxoacyl-ACP synthase III family protein n=1 Tax=Flavobacterium sp. HJJ TaxID=2783792 RepID=UPI00188A6FA4|nr:ketoacyl-ACP synthase III [Flavobacterium sp. HJJ]MBF4470290.1 ketoacyl-ACP synthase III [Flavobacterium sp. HJJ]